MIYRVDDGYYVISSGGMWLPGIYATERAARYAFRFAPTLLEVLAARYTPITFDELREARIVMATGSE